MIRPAASGTRVERITLTPAADECSSAKLEMASATLPESPPQLLGTVNPCALPERALRQELSRAKKGLVFGGANVVMRFRCGTEVRLVRSDVLDRDWFEVAAKTPTYTSWSMALLQKFDASLGPGVMDKPIFPSLSGEMPSEPLATSTSLGELGEGKFDSLFSGAPDKPSDLYRAALAPPSLPSVEVESLTVSPEALTLPEYPPLARMARVEGVVSVRIQIDQSGNVASLEFESGHPLLRPAVQSALSKWKFGAGAPGKTVRASLAFKLNCHPKTANP